MGGGIGARNSIGLSAGASRYSGYLIVRIGVAFIGYLVLLVLCLILNPTENNLPLMVICACATLISTVSLGIACLNAFVKASNAIRAESESNPSDDESAAATKSETTEAADEPESPTEALRKKERYFSIGKKCSLTKREMEVFGLLLEGKNAGDIETQLCISRYTAKTHISSVYRKTDVHSQQELIDYFNQENSHAE